VSGVIARLFRTALVTVTVAVCDTLVVGSIAVMIAVPTDIAVTSPADPAAFEMEATAGTDDDHVTAAVMSWVVPSL
jgi:hypothetical protein